MKKICYSLSISISLATASTAVFAQPTVDGSTISWPSNEWYQVQRPSAQNGNEVDWNVCNSSSDGTSCTVPNGTYTVKKQGGTPWRTLQTWNNIEVSSDGGGTDTVTEPVVDGNTISWPSGDWYQVQRASAQNGNPVDWDVCNSNSNGTSCTVPNGTYTVKKQGGSPWRTLQAWDNVVVGSGGGGGNSDYQEIFKDDFNGNSPSSQFFYPTWPVSGRDSTNTVAACSQSGGILKLGIYNVGDQRQACYMISNKTDFGPGDNGTLKIEYRANVSQVKARGAWFAGWIYASGRNANDEHNSEDNDLNTGAEYDVFEYMPTYKSAYNTAIHDGSLKGGDWIEPGNSLGIDLTKNEYHTFTIEWNKNCVAFSINGNRVHTNTTLASKVKKHDIRLTMEAETGTQWNYWDVGNFADNLSEQPAVGLVDWVKASFKDSIDPALCD